MQKGCIRMKLLFWIEYISSCPIFIWR